MKQIFVNGEPTNIFMDDTYIYEAQSQESTEGGMCSECGVDCAPGTFRCQDCQELAALEAEYEQMLDEEMTAHHEQLDAQEHEREEQEGDWQPAYAREDCGAFWHEGPSEDAEF